MLVSISLSYPSVSILCTVHYAYFTLISLQTPDFLLSSSISIHIYIPIPNTTSKIGVITLKTPPTSPIILRALTYSL